MVAPSPELKSKIKNTEYMLYRGRETDLPLLANTSPRDFMHPSSYDNLMKKEPWKNIKRFQSLDLEGSHLQKSQSYQYSQSQVQKSVLTGSDKILVVLVDFSDRPATISRETIQNRFFGTTGNTLYNYYKENSYNQYLPEGYVFPMTGTIGWYRAPQPLSYYRDDPTTVESDYGMGNYPHNTQKLCEDVLDIMNNDPDFTTTILNDIDKDGNGIIDRIMIVHSGGEAAWGGDINEIWAHVWGINPKIVNGKSFSTYGAVSEYIGQSTNAQRSGVDIHEYGHILDLPDLYDYSGMSEGVGNWSVMSGGSWSNSGITPVHFDIWSKIKLGWINVIPNTDVTGTISLGNSENNQDAAKYTTTDPKEYFLIENRQKVLFDQYLPGSGLLIWRINDNKTKNDDKTCFLVGLLQADGLKQLENNINSGDAGDPFPGLSNIRVWNKTTNPNTSVCDSTLIGIDLSNISDSNMVMTFNSSITTCPILNIDMIMA